MTNSPSPHAIVTIPPADPQEEVVARRKPGRPRVVRPAPDHDEYEYTKAQREARRKLVESDTLLRALETRADATEVVQQVVVRLAEETAALRYDREQAEADGFVVAEKISARRIDGLSKLATAVLEAKKQGIYGDMDLRGPHFQKVERFFLDTIAEALRETAPSETGKLVIDRLVAAMAAWRASLDSPGSGGRR
jgi:hypothetical protein